jgi:hypothetical protein
MYRRIYENSPYDIGTAEVTYKNKNYIPHDPNKNCLIPVKSIVITDLNENWRFYMNLEKNFGGSPRLDAKNKFKEAEQYEDLKLYEEIRDFQNKIHKRFESVNNKRSIRYFSNGRNEGFIWKDYRPILVGVYSENYTENPYYFAKFNSALVISAKKFDVMPEVKNGKDFEIKRLKSMNKRLDDLI